MYAIFAGEQCIYDDRAPMVGLRVLSPKLILEDNAAGSLTVTLPKENVAYDTVRRLTTDISVHKDGVEIWTGRVLGERQDFWNNKTLTCEGALAFFNDSTQTPGRHKNMTVRGYLEELLAVHNQKVPRNRQFVLGAVTVEDKPGDGDPLLPDRVTNREKTIELLLDLVKTYGGHLRVRRDGGLLTLDYLDQPVNTCAQLIQFGSNLLDFTTNWDASGFVTAVIPQGKRLEKSGDEELESYLTLDGEDPCVCDEEAVKTYGRIETVVTWSDVEDQQTLREKAEEYLRDQQFDKMELELSALDLHYLRADADGVKLLDQIRVISTPHGLDKLMTVTKLEIPLDSPEQTQFRLGGSVSVSFSQSGSETQKQLQRLPSSLLQEARRNAAHIMDLATRGYVTIARDSEGAEAIYISSERDYTKAARLWKWCVDGLAYYQADPEDPDPEKRTLTALEAEPRLAITMDGAIVADFITAGTMSADRVRTGVLQDLGSNVVFDLTNGSLTMRKGSIALGEYFYCKNPSCGACLNEQEGYSAAAGKWTCTACGRENTLFHAPGEEHYNFTVSDQGVLYARRGTFAGKLEAAGGTFGGTVQAEDFLDKDGNSMMKGGRFKGQYLDLTGVNIVDEQDRTVLTIDKTGLHFGKGYAPIRAQFAPTAETAEEDWDEEMTESDFFRRDWDDWKGKWGAPYRFRAEKGEPGTPGERVSYNAIKRELKKAAAIENAYLTMDEVGAPILRGGEIYGSKFYGGQFNVYASQADGELNLYAEYDGRTYHMFQIAYFQGQSPTIELKSPCSADIRLGDDNSPLYFQGHLHFEHADTISGLHAAFA